MNGDFFLTQWAFLGMRWLYETLTNESIVLTVIISTILIRGISVFGDIKSRRSSLEMQAIQPQLDKLRKKYESDPKRLNVEQQKLMKENGVSMLGGCLPVLITMPIFFIFIAAFRQWGSEMLAHLIVTMDADPQAGLELFEKFRFLWIHNMWSPDNGMKPVITSAAEFFSRNYETLPRLLYFTEHPEALETFTRLGFFVEGVSEKGATVYSLVTAPSEAVIQTYTNLLQPCADLYPGRNNGWFILPILAAGTTYLSSWLMMRKQPKQESAGANTGKIMQYMMPVLSFVFCLTSNSAFALYWTTSNVFAMITTFFINRAFARKSLQAVEAVRK